MNAFIILQRNNKIWHRRLLILFKSYIFDICQNSDYVCARNIFYQIILAKTRRIRKRKVKASKNFTIFFWRKQKTPIEKVKKTTKKGKKERKKKQCISYSVVNAKSNGAHTNWSMTTYQNIVYHRNERKKNNNYWNNITYLSIASSKCTYLKIKITFNYSGRHHSPCLWCKYKCYCVYI